MENRSKTNEVDHKMSICEDTVREKIDSGILENSNDSSKENTTPLKKIIETPNCNGDIGTTDNLNKCSDKEESCEVGGKNSDTCSEKEYASESPVNDNKKNEENISLLCEFDNKTDDLETNIKSFYCNPTEAFQDGLQSAESKSECNSSGTKSNEIINKSDMKLVNNKPLNPVQKEEEMDGIGITQEEEGNEIKSIEKVTGEDGDGDEFIITMNDSDDTESEEEIGPGERALPSTETNATLKSISLPILKPQNVNCIKEKSITNPSNISQVSINLPPLPPLPQVLNSNQQLPLIPNTLQGNKNKTLPLVSLYIPSTLVKNNASNISTQIKTLKAPNVTVIPSISRQSFNNNNLKQRLNIAQTSNSRSLLSSTSTTKPQITSLLNPKAAMASPQSSSEMMSLIRWEIANRVYHRPKYQQLQPDNELGPLAKFLFDLGNDLVRETVYNDLVRIQTYRKAAGKLSEKEAEDLNKLKDVQADLKDLVGPIKQNLKKKCSCGFRTESSNVLFNHQEYPHILENDLTCAVCADYSTRQPAAFAFHMEVMHNMRGRMEEKHSFWTCNLCPYENNSKSKLTQHRFRCLKNFNLKTNLSQNAIIGMEVNFCLENVLYKRKEPIKQPIKSTPQNYTSSVARPQLTIAPKPKPAGFQQTSVRHMVGGSQMVTFNNRPNLTNKINTLIDKNNQLLSQTKPPPDNSGFEVCEICGGYVKDRKALRIHFYYAHRIEIPAGVFDRTQAPLYCATCFARFWTAQGLQKHLEVHKVNGTSSSSAKCIVCGHKVPNVLMHMRIVHNKELNSYLAAFKCIFCGLVCSSKRGVENHMVAGHGVMVKADSFIASNNSKPSALKVDTPQRGSMCVLCNLHFSRNVDLTRHCMRVHHTCMKCGMVVADKVSLDKHTCLKSGRGLRNCELCHEKGFHPAYHVKHIRDRHIKKCTVNIAKMSPKLLTAGVGGVNIHDVDYKEDFMAALAIKSRVLPIKPAETIEIISDDESPKKPQSKKRLIDEVEILDSDEDTKEFVDKDKSYRPSIPKKKCVEENLFLKDTKNGTIVQPRRSSDSNSCELNDEKSKPGDTLSEGKMENIDQCDLNGTEIVKDAEHRENKDAEHGEHTDEETEELSTSAATKNDMTEVLKTDLNDPEESESLKDILTLGTANSQDNHEIKEEKTSLKRPANDICDGRPDKKKERVDYDDEGNGRTPDNYVNDELNKI